MQDNTPTGIFPILSLLNAKYALHVDIKHAKKIIEIKPT